jgi:hypothetical protein
LEVLPEVELGMGDEAGMVVDEGKEEGLSVFSLRYDRGAVEAVGLPQVVGELRLEAPPVRFENLIFKPVSFEQTVDAVTGCAKIHGEELSLLRHAQQRRHRRSSKLLSERDQHLLRLPVHAAGVPPVRPLLRVQALEVSPALLIGRKPCQHRRAPDGASARTGNVPLLVGNIFKQPLLLPPFPFCQPKQRRNHLKPKQRDLLFLQLFHGTPSFMGPILSVSEGRCHRKAQVGRALDVALLTVNHRMGAKNDLPAEQLYQREERVLLMHAGAGELLLEPLPPISLPLPARLRRPSLRRCLRVQACKNGHYRCPKSSVVGVRAGGVHRAAFGAAIALQPHRSGMAVKVAEHIPVTPETGPSARRATVQPRPWVAFLLFLEDVEIDRKREYNDTVPVVGMG